MSITFVKWINHEEEESPEYMYAPVIGGLGGWVKGEQWKEFLLKATPEDHRPYYEAMYVAIREQNIRFGGDSHQSEHIPVFSDGTVGVWSWRGWGDMLAAAWNTIEDTNKYEYMDFYTTFIPVSNKNDDTVK